MDEFEWNATNESILLQAMVGYKPIGINKYFEMACVFERLHDLEFDVSSDKVWSHLQSMYNLESLDEMDRIPFPNEEKDFYLPELEYGALKTKKDEKNDDKHKVNTSKRLDIKDMKITPAKELKKEDKIINKRDSTPRRDSKDGRDLKTNVKKEVKRELIDKPKILKNRTSANFKDEEKPKTPVRQDEAKRLNKRPTRASIKPDDPLIQLTRKSQSPLTITPSSATKRRRI